MSRRRSFINKSRVYEKIYVNLKQKVAIMTTIQPEGENLRRAVKWISEERKYGSRRKPAELIEEACLKFNLSPIEAEYLGKSFKQDHSR